MTITTEPTRPALLPAPSPLPPARPAPLRLRLLGRALAVTVTAPLAIGLIAVWVTVVAVSPLTIVAPLVLPVTALVRAYADAHRRATSRLLGVELPSTYRPTTGQGVMSRVLTILRDPASRRDLWWLIVHAVAGWFLAVLSVTLLLGSVFYAIYPFLYAVTPHAVFAHPFNGWIDLHSTAQACWFIPVGAALFALWWVVALPLARAGAGIDRRLLGPAC